MSHTLARFKTHIKESSYTASEGCLLQRFQSASFSEARLKNNLEPDAEDQSNLMQLDGKKHDGCFPFKSDVQPVDSSEPTGASDTTTHRNTGAG